MRISVHPSPEMESSDMIVRIRRSCDEYPIDIHISSQEYEKLIEAMTHSDTIRVVELRDSVEVIHIASHSILYVEARTEDVR